MEVSNEDMFPLLLNTLRCQFTGVWLKLTLFADYYRRSNSRSSIFPPKYTFTMECFIMHCEKFISYFVHNTGCALNR